MCCVITKTFYMKLLKTCLFFFLSVIFVSAQETYIEEMSGNTEHPGVLTTVTRNYPNSPIDGYNLYVPVSSFESNEKYPLLIFLQGGLGVGGPVDRLLQWALPYEILKSSSLETELDRYLRDTFIVIMPHISGGQFYEGEAALRSIIDDVLKAENADPNRIYLTGLSRGGYGSWGLASRMDDIIAAVAPVCGDGDGVNDYSSLARVPHWVSHNKGDNVVDYQDSERVIGRLERDHGVKFKRTSTLDEADHEKENYIFTGADVDSHDAWTDFYAHVNFYKWLLRFSK